MFLQELFLAAMTGAIDKTALRTWARGVRRLALAAPEAQAGLPVIRDSAFAVLARQGFVQPGMAVAAYCATADEIDPAPILAALRAAGATPCLPAVDGGDLVFRAHMSGAALERGPLGILQPASEATQVSPHALIVPLLAFDLRGYRLGYGKGYYDRAIRRLRADGRVFAIGLAFEAQRLDLLPWDAWDEPLDAVATEVRVREFVRSAR
jgi:5-formyltetrahydrofolate cyclo-ligase